MQFSWCRNDDVSRAESGLNSSQQFVWLQTGENTGAAQGLGLARIPGAKLQPSPGRAVKSPLARSGRHPTLAGPSKSRDGQRGGRVLRSPGLALGPSCSRPVPQPLCRKLSGAINQSISELVKRNYSPVRVSRWWGGGGGPPVFAVEPVLEVFPDLRQTGSLPEVQR